MPPLTAINSFSVIIHLIVLLVYRLNQGRLYLINRSIKTQSEPIPTLSGSALAYYQTVRLPKHAKTASKTKIAVRKKLSV
jgi:hypothetical protein